MRSDVSRHSLEFLAAKAARGLQRDRVCLRIAYEWAGMGTCGRRLVGCLLCDIKGQPLSSGYNGPASGQPHCRDTGFPGDRACPGRKAKSGTGLDDCEALHAEWNAIALCSDISRIHTCYVTASPCITCVKMLLGTGCRRIVFREEYPHPQAKARWLGGGDDRQWIQLTEQTVHIDRASTWRPQDAAPAV